MQRGIIFDLDGVLVDTVAHHNASWERLAREFGLPFDTESADALRGRSREDALELFLGGRAAPGPHEVLLERKNRYFLESISRPGALALAPGAARLLSSAREAGVLLGLASASRNARLVCDQLGITDLFQAFAQGGTTERSKPAPDLFLWVADRLGLPPERCTVVEDAASAIRGAKAAGFRAVGIGPAARVGDADLVLPSLAGARLEQLLGPEAGARRAG